MTIFLDGLLNEQAFALTVNGRNVLSVLMLPELLEEFAAGYLTTEALVVSSDIESIMIDDQTIGVLTRNPFKVLLSKRAIVSGCGGTASYLDPAKLPVITGGIRVTAADLTAVFPAAVLRAGGYSAVVYHPNGPAFTASDISQHAAIDKVTGLLLRRGFHLADAALIISGKATADTVRKTLNAGFSVLAAYQPPTALAVRTAHAGNLTLVEMPDGKIHTHPQRVR